MRGTHRGSFPRSLIKLMNMDLPATPLLPPDQTTEETVGAWSHVRDFDPGPYFQRGGQWKLRKEDP